MADTKEKMVEIAASALEGRTYNGSFCFKGEKAYDISAEFFDWCEEMAEKHGLTLMHNRGDYNGVWQTNRLLTKETK